MEGCTVSSAGTRESALGGRLLTRSSPILKGEAHHAAHHPRIAHGGARHRTGARATGPGPAGTAATPDLETGPARQHGGLDAGTHSAAPRPEGAGRDSRRQDPGPARVH